MSEKETNPSPQDPQPRPTMPPPSGPPAGFPGAPAAPAATKAPWHARTLGLRSVIAVGAAGMLLGGLAGAGIGVAAADDEPTGPGETSVEDWRGGPPQGEYGDHGRPPFGDFDDFDAEGQGRPDLPEPPQGEPGDGTAQQG